MGIFALSSVSGSASVTILCTLVSLCPVQCDNSTVHPESRIIFGENVAEGEFPHQVFLATFTPLGDGNYSIGTCGGSILNEDYILTAGHCLINATPTNTIFVVGKTNRSHFLRSDQYNASEIIIHPCYNQSNPNDFLNDIAIVKVAKPLPLNGQNIEAIQIDQQDVAVDNTFTAAIGWGRTNASDEGGKGSAMLKIATLKVVTSQCKQLRIPIEPDGQICAYNSEAFTCKGDSGGPLLCDDRSRTTTVLCGITSTGYNLRNQPQCHGPSVYTRVHHYRKWIKSVLKGKRHSTEGCIGERYLPSPYHVRDYEYDETSRAFLSRRPNNFLCTICLISCLIFPCWARKFF